VSERVYSGLADPLVTEHCPNCHRRRVRLDGHARGQVDPFCSTVCCKAWWSVQNATEELPDFDQHGGTALLGGAAYTREWRARGRQR
jgi:hypothetical protein